MKILITGFEPIRQFYDVNPSWEAVKELPDEIDGVEIIKEEIPIVYDKAERVLEELIEKHSPAAVINVGQSGHDRGIMVEKIGVNWDDFNVPDNAGNMRIDEKVVEDGPAAYFTTLPCRKIAEARCGNSCGTVGDGGHPSLQSRDLLYKTSGGDEKSAHYQWIYSRASSDVSVCCGRARRWTLLYGNICCDTGAGSRLGNDYYGAAVECSSGCFLANLSQ